MSRLTITMSLFSSLLAMEAHAAESFKASRSTLLMPGPGSSANCNVMEGSDLQIIDAKENGYTIQVKMLSGECQGRTGLMSPENIKRSSDAKGLHLSRSTPILSNPMSDKIVCWGFENSPIRKLGEERSKSVEVELQDSAKNCSGWISTESLSL